MSYYVKKFNSLYSYNEYLRAGKLQSGFHEASQSTDEPEWYGTESYQQAETMLCKGNHELASNLYGKMKNVSAVNDGVWRESVMQAKMVRGAVGYRTNIGAFLAGSKKCMLRKQRQRIQHPVLTILYNNGARAGESASKMVETNARVLRAIQKIEQEKGIRVNLYASQLSRSNRDIAGPIVRIKDSDTIMDVEKIAYPLLSPSMLRRQKFRYLEVTQGMPTHFADGYGSSLDDNRKLTEAAESANVKADICITYYEAKEMSDNDLMAYFTAKKL